MTLSFVSVFICVKTKNSLATLGRFPKFVPSLIGGTLVARRKNPKMRLVEATLE